MQNRPHDAALHRHPGLDRGRGNIANDSSAGNADPNTEFTGIAVRLQLIQHTQALERTKRRAGDADAGAVDAPLWIALNEIDFPATLAHADCERHAGDPAADHQQAVLSHESPPW